MATKLPYTKTTTFAFAGQTYPEEASVVRAAIEAILKNPGITSAVMLECCVLAPLLARACELGLGTQPPAVASAQ